MNKPWPVDTIERWPLARIKPYPQNARLHSDQQVEQIAASMKRFGVTSPVLVDEDGVLIYGHGRLRAAQSIGLKELPVAVARGWTEDEKKAYRIADNQIGIASRWDDQILRVELVGLQRDGFDLPLLGFDDGFLKALEIDLVAGDTAPSDEWLGMPEFDQQSKRAFRSLVVHFKDQQAVDKFAKAVKCKLTPDTRFVWYPEIEIETYVDKRYKVKK